MNTKISTAQREAITKSISNGDAHLLEQYLIEFKDDSYFNQWDEALKIHSKESAGSYEKAYTIIIYNHCFNNWGDYKKFKGELTQENTSVSLFEQAADAVVSGDTETLTELIQKHPDLIHARSMRNHRATLLIYVGVNGVEDFRQKTPPNAVEMAELLLNAGAEVDAFGDMYRGTITLGLVATSEHPVKAGLQRALIEVLLKYGADINHSVVPDYTEGLLINNGRCEIVEYLAEKGAKLDLEGAAGTGILYEVKKYYNENGSLKDETNAPKRDYGFMWACVCGRKLIVEYMLYKGFDVSTLTDGMTALHLAVIGRQLEIVDILLKYNAPLEIKNGYDGTVLGQALWSAYNDPSPQDTEIVDRLIRAGAIVEPGWEKYIDEINTREN